MSSYSKPSSNPSRSSTRVPSYSSSEHAASASLQTSTASPVAANSSILSEPLSNIDFDRMEANSSSDSDLTPIVPWGMRAGTRNEGGNTLVTQTYRLGANTPHLTHVEWRNYRSGPRRHKHLQKGKGKRAHKSGSAALPMSRDFFLLVALCIGLACALICLARPFIASILT